MKITGKQKIKEILDEYPVSLNVFFSNGFSYGSQEGLLGAVGGDTMLQTALQVKNINPELFPELLLSKEFNQYLGKCFRERMVDKGYFTAGFYQDKRLNPNLVQARLPDPEEQYAVYGIMADVLLVDDNHLNGSAFPRTRAKLLEPEYKDNIILFGKDRSEISNATFLYIYREFGMEGIKRLAHNVKHCLHGAQMAKTAGSKNLEGAAIYIVSWFFANTCIKPNTRIVWPSDGCMTLPMFMLVRKDMAEQEKDIIAYILGDEFAQVCCQGLYPPILVEPPCKYNPLTGDKCSSLTKQLVPYYLDYNRKCT